MADQTHLLQPFLTKPTTKVSISVSDSSLLLRLFSVILIGAISLWANHEASKGFTITIINEAKDSASKERFVLYFESDDTATRILLDTSFSVERYLYENVPHRLKKRVSHVMLRFNGNNSLGTEKFSVTSGASHGEYVIRLSSSYIGRNEFINDVRSALRRSMVRVWLYGEATGASPELVAGMVEYLAVEGLKRRRFGEDKEYVYMAKWLGYCEGQSEGFIRRLNYGMRLTWHDRTVDLASSGACNSRRDMFA
ncbi:unnamed protein product [Cochlearia groenlandica]